MSTHAVPPMTILAPIPMAQGESRAPPQAGITAAATRMFLFFFCSSLGWESSRVLCWPCASVVVPLSWLMVGSPFRAAIWTLPSTSLLTSNSVQLPEAGDPVTPPAGGRQQFRGRNGYAAVLQLFRARTLAPVAWMLATESAFVRTRSPEKIADDLAMLPPLRYPLGPTLQMGLGYSRIAQPPDPRKRFKFRLLKSKRFVPSIYDLSGRLHDDLLCRRYLR
jgi:hypothetical protein